MSSMRTCPSCGATKAESAFWHSARRCRSCVAKERSEHVRGERASIQQRFGTRTSVSGRRLRHLEKDARHQAETHIPATSVDHIGTVFIVLAPVCLFAGIFLTDESPVFLLLGVVSAFVVGSVGVRLQAPREAALSSRASVTLRNAVRVVDQQQQVYEEFYRTADWRNVRRDVIKRDGAICRRCGQRIHEPNDVTVDHIRPRSKHPHLAFAMSNLQVLCRRCNSSKGVS